MCRTLLSVMAFIGSLGPAQAGTLTYSSYTMIDPRTVTLGGTVLGRQENAFAGEITLQGINGGTGAISTFCIDIANWLTSSGQFTAGTYLTGSFADQVNALITHVLPAIGTNSNASAALQVAIWQAEYGADLVVGGNNDVTGLAASYLGYVRSGAWTADRSMQVAVLDGHGTTQSQAYLARVSEPASLALLGTALLSAMVWRRRRRSGRPGYSRLAMHSINCRPAKGFSDQM